MEQADDGAIFTSAEGVQTHLDESLDLPQSVASEYPENQSTVLCHKNAMVLTDSRALSQMMVSGRTPGMLPTFTRMDK